VARVQRRLAADRGRRTTGPACRRRHPRAGTVAAREPARLLELPDNVVLYPSHYGGSVCGRGLSGNPISSIGFERAHNPLLAVTDPDAFGDALVADMPSRPAEQERIVAANRSGRVRTPA
jgi:hydroxyacylglutathione hydrolase